MRREKILEKLAIRPSDFVVEIGAGTTPFRNTRLIVDKYPFDNLERAGDIAGTAPVIQADAVRLPLKRDSCDVLFMSHVIEHLDEPQRFVDEARRCARNVYLEFPAARRELLYAWRYHRWLVELAGRRLVFHRNDVPQLFGSFFHDHYDLLLDVWSGERHDHLNQHWFGRPDELEIEFARETALEHLLATSARGADMRDFPNPYAETGVGPVDYPRSARLKLALWSLTPESLIRARRRRMQRNRRPRRPLGDDILRRLLCQACRDDSARIERAHGDGELACSLCGRRYRSRQGIFDFDLAAETGT
jgi:SAM-dependent methyltransferase